VSPDYQQRGIKHNLAIFSMTAEIKTMPCRSLIILRVLAGSQKLTTPGTDDGFVHSLQPGEHRSMPPTLLAGANAWSHQK